MRPKNYVALAALLWVFLVFGVFLTGGCGAAHGQWGSGGCGGSAAMRPLLPLLMQQPLYQPKVTETPRFVWRDVPGDASQAALFEYGKQIGNYSFETGKFRRLATGDVWLDAGLPASVPTPEPSAAFSVRPKGKQKSSRPCAKACGCDKCGDGCDCGSGPTCSTACRCVVPTFPIGNVRADEPLTGVCSDKVHAGRTTLNGKDISHQRASEILSGGATLTDDSKLNHLTCIGTAEECKQLLADWSGNPSLSAYKNSVAFQVYTPDAGRIKDAGFKVDGHPSIYLQAPSGEVLHRQDGYRGPDKLAEAIRKADPSYDPSKDPDLNKAPAPPTPAPFPLPMPPPAGSIPWFVWAGVAGLGFLALKKR